MTNVRVTTANFPAGRLGRDLAMNAVRSLTYAKQPNMSDIIVLQEVEEIRRLTDNLKGWETNYDDFSAHPELVILTRESRVNVIDRFSHEVIHGSKWGYLLGVRVEVAGTPLTVMNFHTPHRADLAHPVHLKNYRAQVKGLIELADRHPNEPFLAGADWNKTPDSWLLNPLEKAGFQFVSAGPTHGFARKPKPIDFFVARGHVAVRGKRVLDSVRFGDHRPMRAVFEI